MKKAENRKPEKRCSSAWLVAAALVVSGAVPALMSPASAAPDRVLVVPRVLDRVLNDRVLKNRDLTRIPSRFRKLSFYKLQTSQLDASFLSDMSELKVRSVGEKQGATIAEDGEGARGFFVPGANPQLTVLPDLRDAKTEAPSAEKATDLALQFVKQHNLAPREGSQKLVPQISVWSRHDIKKGGEGKTLDVIRSVRLARQLDGLEVVGPSSILAVNVGSDGVKGFTDTMRPAEKSEIQAKLRPQAEIEREFRAQLEKDMRGLDNTKTNISKSQLQYFEQGENWIQPVYRFDVEFIHADGTRSAEAYFIAAASNSPEPIREHEEVSERPTLPSRDGAQTDGKSDDTSTVSPLFKLPKTNPRINPRMEDMSAQSSTRLPWQTQTQSHAQAGGPIKVGLYIVREDDSCWLADANSFMNNLNSFNWITGRPAKQRSQYYWDHDWLWQTAGGVSDQSMNYGGKVNMIMLEGHGAPWVMTTLKNNGDFIHLNQMAGMGANRGAGQITNYMIWHSCDVIPVPGDAYGWDYASGSPFDVWWTQFKGMRGAYGYHVTMYICDGVGGTFGTKIGLGVPNLAAWLDCTANNALGHANGWDYGSAVIVSGHENDRLYDTAGLANPSSLTMWWNHA